jgi:hypothetical protein
MSSVRTTVLAGLILLVSTGVTAEIYKCTDAQGSTRYSDKPCAGDAVIITPAPAPVVSEDTAGRMEKTQRLLRAYEAEHQEARRVEAEQKAEQEQRKRNCIVARNYERGVTRSNRVYRTDESGQRIDLTFEERAAEEARARAEVTRWCDSK